MDDIEEEHQEVGIVEKDVDTNILYMDILLMVVIMIFQNTCRT